MVVNRRETWVDNIKTIACILVVLGHFFQSMTKAEILPVNDLHLWFNQTIYYFHVPIFFICSGYLYQGYSRVDTVNAWWHNVLKKLLVLGVPYVTFSSATWILKTAFSNSVNNEIGGIFNTLLITPTSPYWYLYALFCIFLITPTFGNKKIAGIGLLIALAFKIMAIVGGGCGIAAVSYILANEIWFVMGMYLCAVNFTEVLKNKKFAGIGCIGLVLFVGLSVVVYRADTANNAVGFAMGILACVAILAIAIGAFGHGHGWILNFLAKYTMPIFLMHTLFAAPVRVVLLKVGISNTMVHVAVGLTVSFMGPVAAAWIMKKSKWLEFLLYPAKFVKSAKNELNFGDGKVHNEQMRQ